MNPHLDAPSTLSSLKKSDLETFVFELVHFLCIVFLEGKGGGKERERKRAEHLGAKFPRV